MSFETKNMSISYSLSSDELTDDFDIDRRLRDLARYFKCIPEMSVTLENAAIYPTKCTSKEHLESGYEEAILVDINAQINQGELVLVVGDNSSNFLKGLNNQARLGNPKSIYFKDLPSSEFFQKHKHQIIYNNEKDVHFPYLTVGQTIEFAIDCKFNLPKKEKMLIKDHLLVIFGLEQCANTIVGNDTIIGASGGQRKRLSIIEAFLANGSVYLWDQLTKGLDSSTSLEAIESLKTMAQLTNSINLIGVSQASEKILKAFDKIMVFFESHQVFYGSINEALEFFFYLGYEKPEHESNIEFLTSIIHKKANNIHSFHPTAKEMSDVWKKSKYFNDMCCEINAPKAHFDHESSKFQVSTIRQFYYCTKRSWDRFLGDKTFLWAQTTSILVQALVIGSLFYQIPLTTIGSFSRGSLIFFSLLFFGFQGIAEIPVSFSRRPIIFKQKNYYFYHPYVETISTFLADAPVKLGLVIVFSIILYFLAHLQYKASRFFIFVLFLFFSTEAMSLWFQAVAYVSPTMAIANSLGGIMLLSIAMYASYVIYLNSMLRWAKWISYIDVIRYSMEALLANELFDLELDCTETIIPRGPAYDNITMNHKICGWQGAKLGYTTVKGANYLKDGLGYKYSHVWRNFGIMMAFLVFFLVFSALTSQFVTVRFENTIVKKLEEKFDPQDVHSIEEESITFTNKDTLMWKNINYTINGTRLLNDISGFVKPGTLTALMGESGAGKTTLLNVLSHRTEAGTVTGEILINGHPVDVSLLKKSVGYVQQQDVHLQWLTVQESLEFACKLRGDGDLSYCEEIANYLNLRMSRLVSNLNLTEMKMLSIGTELVTKPSLLLFLDEPTSGLDSEAAITVVRLLKKLSLRGQAILCTIHQPSSNVFQYFDNVLLLKKGGETVYSGPTNEVVEYFVSRGDLRFNRGDNPAEFILDAVGAGAAANSEKDWFTFWNDSSNCSVLESQLRDLIGEVSALKVHEKPSYISQLVLTCERQFKVVCRDKMYVIAKMALSIVAGLFIGFTFFHNKITINGMQNLMFAAFMILAVSSPLINQIQAKAAEAKDVFTVRESKSNTFHWSILIISQIVVETPLVILSSTLLFVCFYFCLGVDNSPNIAGVFYLNYLTFGIYYMTFGLWLIYSCSDLQSSHVFVAFLFSFTVSFCGVMQPYALFPRFWKFMYRLSTYNYLVDTFVSILLHNRPVRCAVGEFAPVAPLPGQTCGDYLAPFIASNGGYLKYPKNLALCAYCMYDSGDQFLKQQGMSYSHRWRNFGIIWGFIVFNIVAALVGYYLLYIRRVYSCLWRKFSK